MNDERYYFSSYYKYGFCYRNKKGNRMDLCDDYCNPDDIYRMSLSYEMTEQELIDEGFEKDEWWNK